MTAKDVTIAPELLERAGKVARDKGVSIDELASEALRRELGRLSLERLRLEGESRRRRMSDEEVEHLRDAEAAISAATYRVAPTETLDVVQADATDNRIVECGVASSSETIVSGDRHLLALGQFRGISVLRVGDFLLRKSGRT